MNKPDTVKAAEAHPHGEEGPVEHGALLRGLRHLAAQTFCDLKGVNWALF